MCNRLYDRNARGWTPPPLAPFRSPLTNGVRYLSRHQPPGRPRTGASHAPFTCRTRSTVQRWPARKSTTSTSKPSLRIRSRRRRRPLPNGSTTGASWRTSRSRRQKGFSTRTAKYAFGGNSWSLQQKRVSDESKEGISAAEAERNIRKTMANLTWQSRPHTATKPCEAKGAYKGMVLVESDTSGVKHREAVRFSLPNDRLSCVTNQANLFRVCLACPPCTHAPCAIGVVDANAQIPISRRRMPHGRSRPGREISKASDSQPGGGMASKNVSGQWAPRS